MKRSYIFLGFLLAVLVISTEVVAETSQDNKEKKATEQSQTDKAAEEAYGAQGYGGGWGGPGGGGGGWGGGPGGGGWGGPGGGGGWGGGCRRCCGYNRWGGCICCGKAEEAKQFAGSGHERTTKP